MISKSSKGIVILLLIAFLHFQATAQDNLNEHLEPFRPFLNKTWKAIVSESEDKKPVYDIATWERILNGQGIRILHSVNNGAYGGETIIVWDTSKKELIYYYFTTAGFFTNGTIQFEKGKMISHEYVIGKVDGPSEVKSISEILPDGTMAVTTQFFKKGAWSEGKQVVYIADSKVKVIFK